jgi:hypothetical protein
MTNSLEALKASMKAAAELISGGYSRKWIVSHDDETCWVGANDDDGNLTPFIEVSIGDWSGNKADNEVLAKFVASSHPKNILKLIAALEQAQQRIAELEKSRKSWAELANDIEQMRKQWADIAIEMGRLGDEKDKRIAELEAAAVKPVKLPEGYVIRAGHPIYWDEKNVMIPKEGGNWLSQFDVEHTLRASGITVEGS